MLGIALGIAVIAFGLFVYVGLPFLAIYGANEARIAWRDRWEVSGADDTRAAEAAAAQLEPFLSAAEQRSRQREAQRLMDMYGFSEAAAMRNVGRY